MVGATADGTLYRRHSYCMPFALTERRSLAMFVMCIGPLFESELNLINSAC